MVVNPSSVRPGVRPARAWLDPGGGGVRRILPHKPESHRRSHPGGHRGTGILPEGEIQADSVTLATREAALAFQDVLTMCLRAFEYLPIVDITFGDYLRAIVTADSSSTPGTSTIDVPRSSTPFERGASTHPRCPPLAEEALRLERPKELEDASIPPTLVTPALTIHLLGPRGPRGDPGHEPPGRTVLPPLHRGRPRHPEERPTGERHTCPSPAASPSTWTSTRGREATRSSNRISRRPPPPSPAAVSRRGSISGRSSPATPERTR